MARREKNVRTHPDEDVPIICMLIAVAYMNRYKTFIRERGLDGGLLREILEWYMTASVSGRLNYDKRGIMQVPLRVHIVERELKITRALSTKVDLPHLYCRHKVQCSQGIGIADR